MTRYDAPPSAKSQCGRIFRVLEANAGAWVPLPEILALGVAQYGTRIKELRDDWGFAIENRTETINGMRHSWFRLARPVSPDWLEREHGARPKNPTPTDALPLFWEAQR